MRKKISILTGCGQSLGTGHAQRMATLVTALDRTIWATSELCSESIPAFLPEDVARLCRSSFSWKPDLIIRDMRDSTEREILDLKKTAPVLVIDDCGEGRNSADYVCDILPCVRSECADRPAAKGHFLYGYSFTEELRHLGCSAPSKEIDVALYAGMTGGEETARLVIDSLPERASCALLQGSASMMISNGKRTPLPDRTYAHTLLSTRCLISHFGIMLYEGRLANCRLLCVNPTEYHSTLADVAAADLGLVNLGTWNLTTPESLRLELGSCLEGGGQPPVRPDEALEKAETSVEKFVRFLKELA